MCRPSHAVRWSSLWARFACMNEDRFQPLEWPNCLQSAREKYDCIMTLQDYEISWNFRRIFCDFSFQVLDDVCTKDFSKYRQWCMKYKEWWTLERSANPCRAQLSPLIEYSNPTSSRIVVSFLEAGVSIVGILYQRFIWTVYFPLIPPVTFYYLGSILPHPFHLGFSPPDLAQSFFSMCFHFSRLWDLFFHSFCNQKSMHMFP